MNAKFTIRRRKVEKLEMRGLKAQGEVFQGLVFPSIYSCTSFAAIYGLLSGRAVIGGRSHDLLLTDTLVPLDASIPNWLRVWPGSAL